MQRIDIMEPGGGKLADYPFVRRLLNRRLIIYLYLQGFEPAYNWIVHETDLYMSGRRLQQLVACGQWLEALTYIRRFLPPTMGGVEARTLYFFLDTFWALDNAGACSTGAPVTTTTYNHDVRILTAMCASSAKLSSILHKIHNLPQFRASLDWKLVREKASLIANDLAFDTPELRRSLLLPGGPRSPHDLLPIGPRHSRRHSRKQPLRPAPSAIAKCYLNRKRSLPSSSPVIGVSSERLNRMVDLIGAFSTPFAQTMLGTTGLAKNIETSSVTNAGAPTFTGLPNHFCWYPSVANSGVAVSQPAKIPWITSATNSGAFSPPFSQTMLGTTGPAKNIETSSVTNAGAPTFTALPNYFCWYPSVANSGAPVSQPAKTSGITSATNANPVKHLRARLTTAEEDDDPDKKRQRTKLLSTETEAGSCSANLMA